MAKVRVVLNRQAVRDEILRSQATAQLVDGIARTAAEGLDVETVVGKVRARAFVRGSMKDETNNGRLSRVIGKAKA